MSNYHYNNNLFVRPLFPGIGEAVAARTFLRPNEDWSDVATRVALGNSLLHPSGKKDLLHLEKHIASGLLLMSGRHLQHGDETQPNRNLEVFSNCSTACTSSMKFYLLLNGSGVGRSYDNDLMLVDWRNLPEVKLLLTTEHQDYNLSETQELKAYFGCLDLYYLNNNAIYHQVQDSREGWGKAVELLEEMAFENQDGRHNNKTIYLDFSKVRGKGQPIKGMQNRPSAGPIPTMRAILNIIRMTKIAKQESWANWKQNLYVDHYLADCVHLGGARRAARISVKYWKDEGILEYSRIKRDGGLWSANMSVGVDEDFYQALNHLNHPDHEWATKVANMIVDGQFHDLTGEPGIVNLHKLSKNNQDLFDTIDLIGSKVYPISPGIKSLYKNISLVVKDKKWQYIVNPCGEIVLSLIGGFCIIADIALGCAKNLTKFRTKKSVARNIVDCVKATVRALIRVNLLPSVYDGEVKRTNRIGVSLTGIHEFAWLGFGYSFRDLLNEEKSKDFWNFISYLKQTVSKEAERYSKEIGVVTPHTDTTIKPSGSVSKLFGLTEGGHLPSMEYYLRWVQFQKEDPLILDYEKDGYPIMRDLKGYEHVVLVGFPTAPYISDLGMGDKLVTAGQATVEEQFQWLRLLEKYWIVGFDDNQNQLKDTGNQISYTLKYDPKQITRDEFYRLYWSNQETVKCCAVMPQTDVTAYAYQPEEPISKYAFDKIVNNIKARKEIVTLDELQCSSGACPI